ncbi:hypothetical protein V9T40_011878 [Parthenolecanium corni]|uniref:Uncharacterized protein n=1 Tax=Parthenolecanium corni TaxID=536013 RepID=A0AAN9TJH4_9HEMI
MVASSIDKIENARFTEVPTDGVESKIKIEKRSWRPSRRLINATHRRYTRGIIAHAHKRANISIRPIADWAACGRVDNVNKRSAAAVHCTQTISITATSAGGIEE